jgi:hypothetical protein
MGNLVIEHAVCEYKKGNDSGIFSNYKRFYNYSIAQYCKEQGYMIYRTYDIEKEIEQCD